MAPGDKLTWNGDDQIMVYGALDAQGVLDNRITFTGAADRGDDPGAGSLIYVAGEGSVNLVYCDLTNGEYGLYFNEVNPGRAGIGHRPLPGPLSVGLRHLCRVLQRAHTDDHQLGVRGH